MILQYILILSVVLLDLGADTSEQRTHMTSKRSNGRDADCSDQCSNHSVFNRGDSTSIRRDANPDLFDNKHKVIPLNDTKQA